jgi:hypothetical protein
MCGRTSIECCNGKIRNNAVLISIDCHENGLEKWSMANWMYQKKATIDPTPRM